MPVARGRAGGWALRVLLAGGLAVDAYTHADLARFYAVAARPSASRPCSSPKRGPP
jgi:hypothetical protein